MITLFFNSDKVTDWNVAAKSDTKQFAKFFWGLIERGIYFPCSQYEALFVSAAHSTRDIEDTISAASEVLKEMNG
jgi:glutamate-1-semialdehyde 2,1-aminomutase